MKLFGTVVATILVCVIVVVIAAGFGMFADGVSTISKEYKPSALLKKYEYFKDLSAGIDKKRADIEMYREEIKSFNIIGLIIRCELLAQIDRVRH